MATLISDPSVVVNNTPTFILPNTLVFTEGFGEGDVTNQSAGNGIIDQLDADNVETQIGMVKFSMAPTVPNINKARLWKANRNQNSVSLTATTPEDTLTRNFAQMKLVNDYEVALQTDGVLELEFKGRRATI